MMTISRFVESGHVTTAEKEIRYEGIWWLPSRPDDEVPGTLIISPENGIWLNLLGMFEGENEESESRFRYEFHDHECILGIHRNGYRMTLSNCRESRRVEPFGGGFMTQRYGVQTVLGDAHFESPEEMLFSELLFDFTYLKDWLRNVGLGTPKQTEKGFTIEYDVTTATTIPEIVAQTDIGKISIKSEAQWFDKGSPEDEVGIKILEWIEIETSQAMSIDNLVSSFVEPLRNFISFATTRSNSVTDFIVYLPPQSEGENPRLRPIKVYTLMYYERVTQLSLFNKGIILFYAKAIADNADHILSRWLHLHDEIRDILDLFFGVHYNQSMFPTNRFLSVVQTLESYHRVRKGEYEMDPEIHRGKCQEILNAIPHGVLSSKRRKRLKSALRSQNRKNLIDRLNELFEDISTIMGLVVKNRDLFVKRVVDTRNYFTHWDEERKEHSAEGLELNLLTRTLLWLVRLHLMCEMGFSEDQCQEHIGDNERFKQLCETNKKYVEW